MASAFPLIRNTAALEAGDFDLVVVGGGIYGAWAAYDAALRGLRVALIEKADWGAGTSSASSKLIHGGLRYLEHYDFALVRHALRERRTLFRLAPHLVRPVNFILPVWRGPRASPFLISAGLTLYDLLAFGGQPVPRHRYWRAAALRARYPFVDPERLLGGFRYGDCQEDDARMTLVVVAAAQAAGCVCASRVSALELQADAVTARDELSGKTLILRSRAVINAAGPWAAPLLGGQAPRVRLVKGTHLVLPAIPGVQEAFLLTATDGRVFFVIPWYGKTLVGTTESVIQQAEDAQPTEAEAQYLIRAVHNGLPGLGWTEADILARFAGTRTLQAEDQQNLSAVSREFEILEPRPGVFMPLGGKYTTARLDAARVVDRICRRLGRRTASRTHRQPLPGTPAGQFDAWLATRREALQTLGVDAEAATQLCLRHGSRESRVRELIAEQPGWAARLHPDAPFLIAEVVLAIRDEMALSVDDILRRRLPLALLVAQDARLDAARSEVSTLLARERAG
ncbi:MAG: FAD-dependent oxidoreductase [Gammaproteobacteria bacterium]